MIIIGEKINGSIPKCGAAIAARDEEYIREMTRIQDHYGATYIDCCASVNENELETMKWMVDLIMQETDLPIALDSPDPQVLVDAMPFCGDRVGLINSVSGEGDKIDIVFPAIADTKWSVFALLSDDTGIPADVDGRMRVFHDIMKRAEEFGIAPNRIFIDPLVETLGANPDALETVCECTRLIKAEYPTIHVAGALSNISFGLPGRKFIKHGCRHGRRHHGPDESRHERRHACHRGPARRGRVLPRVHRRISREPVWPAQSRLIRLRESGERLLAAFFMDGL